MKQPGVSYVIPVHNGGRYLAEAVRSVLRQTLRPSEIIVIDDGSSDGTPEEAARFRDQVVYRRQQHAGASAARNHGLSLSKGAFVCFLDADDSIHAAKLSRQLEAVRKRPELEFCDGHARFFWSEELSLEERLKDPRYHHDFWQQTTPGQIGTWLVRRDLFERFGKFDESLHYSEDTDWYLRVRDGRGVMQTLPDVLAYRRLHRGNATLGNRAGQVGGLVRAIKASLDRKRGSTAETR